MSTAIVRLRNAVMALLAIVAAGTLGYRAFGLSWTDAAYQTVTTVATVGFRELHEFSIAEKWFTMAIIVTGVSVTLYTFTLAVQVVLEGHLHEFLEKRKMDRSIADMFEHVVICGWGRVGRAVAEDLDRAGHSVVIVDIDESRVVDVGFPTIVGDATLDETLEAAGIKRAKALVAAVNNDAENLFVTLSSRALNPGLFIVARARQESSVTKLSNAGADRVVNPQELGAARMASFVSRPHVAEFIDVVMHERSMAFRMQEVAIPSTSPLAGVSLADAKLRERTGALVLALRGPDGAFNTNPDPNSVLHADHVIIAVGTDQALSGLSGLFS
jgi:voltage-gated potassium channel